HDAGTIELVEGLLGENAVVRDGLDVQEATVGRKADLPESGEVPEAFADIKILGVVNGRLGAQRLTFFVVLLDARTLIVNVHGWTPSVMTRVRKLPGVLLVPPRSKISCTCLGRPMSRFSRITSSKKILPLTGRSNTWVRESSICRMEIWYRYPAWRSRAGNGCGNRRSHYRSKASIFSADKESQMLCSRLGSAQYWMTFFRARCSMPARSNGRLAYSWPFRQSLAW